MGIASLHPSYGVLTDLNDYFTASFPRTLRRTINPPELSVLMLRLQPTPVPVKIIFIPVVVEMD
jgi:hypothetical protein